MGEDVLKNLLKASLLVASILSVHSIFASEANVVEKPAQSSEAAAQTAEKPAQVSEKPGKEYPMGVTPTHVFDHVIKMNAYIDALLIKEKVRKWQKLPGIENTIRPSVVFQLAIATVELFHDFELREGLRPIPVITSSPIEYYPADVYFVVNMLIGRLEKIAKAEKIFHVSIPKPREGERTPYDSYEELLKFYMKLAALDGITEITSNQTYSQLHRAREEMKSIIIHSTKQVRSAMKRRLLVSSMIGIHPTGPRLGVAPSNATSKDVYHSCLNARKIINSILKSHGMHPIPVPLFDKAGTYGPVDVFVQSQIMLAELSELKRILGVADSSPVTKQAEEKMPQDVLQENMALIYMLERYREVLHD